MLARRTSEIDQQQRRCLSAITVHLPPPPISSSWWSFMHSRVNKAVGCAVALGFATIARVPTDPGPFALHRDIALNLNALQNCLNGQFLSSHDQKNNLRTSSIFIQRGCFLKLRGLLHTKGSCLPALHGSVIHRVARISHSAYLHGRVRL
jgi:hypothetical protein